MKKINQKQRIYKDLRASNNQTTEFQIRVQMLRHDLKSNIFGKLIKLVRFFDEVSNGIFRNNVHRDISQQIIYIFEETVCRHRELFICYNCCCFSKLRRFMYLF